MADMKVMQCRAPSKFLAEERNTSRLWSCISQLSVVLFRLQYNVYKFVSVLMFALPLHLSIVKFLFLLFCLAFLANVCITIAFEYCKILISIVLFSFFGQHYQIKTLTYKPCPEKKRPPKDVKITMNREQWPLFFCVMNSHLFAMFVCSFSTTSWDIAFYKKTVENCRRQDYQLTHA